MSIYDDLGVRVVVNAAGPVTRLSGAVMADEVLSAMAEAGRCCVDIAELQAAAGSYIAEVTGAESGYVTSGAAAGLLMGVAACVTGLDPGRMNRLPDTRGMKNEVIIGRSHRNFYDHAIRQVGVTLVEVGLPDRFSGAGVRDTEAWEIGDAITENTAAVAYVATGDSRPALTDVAEVARAKGVPVIVDAAGQLPPVSNLKRFIAEGADLVCFSGGKAIGGPQGSGILCGRRALVSAAALQHLDQDVLFELWQPPASLIDKGSLPGAPQHGIGRPCKVGKEQIVGLVAALRKFVAVDDEKRKSEWRSTLDALATALEDVSGAPVEVVDGRIPSVHLMLDSTGISGVELLRRLEAGTPSVHVNAARIYDNVLVFNPLCLREGDVGKIAGRVREEMQR